MRNVGEPVKVTILVLIAGAIFAGCATQPPPGEVSDDGLVLVPTSLLDELYVAPNVSLANYKRVIVEPVEVAFKDGWRKKHPDMRDSEVEALRARLAGLLHEKLVKELARGGYLVAESPDKDVLRLRPSLENIDLAAPEANNDKRTFVHSDGEMTLRVLGFDGPSGALVARAKDYEEDPETQILQRADRITTNIAAEKMFDKWAQALRSALDVANVNVGARKISQ